MPNIKNTYQETSFFWTDTGQARDRLNSTVIMYDGEPYKVMEIRDGEGYTDGVPRAVLRPMGMGRSAEPKLITRTLSSPKFEKFRALPPLGWVNMDRLLSGSRKVAKNAVFLKRRSQRRVSHGFNNNNIYVYGLYNTKNSDPVCLSSGGSFRFVSDVAMDVGYMDACLKRFPPMEDILANVEEGSIVAYNPLYAIQRDNRGMFWLLRETTPVGFFAGADTLILLKQGRCYREEIQLDPTFTCNTIKEF